MTPKQTKAMTAYVTTLQRLMSLDHWQLIVDPLPPESDSDTSVEMIEAESFVRHQANVATLRFPESIFRASRADARQTVVHEMVHVLTHHWTRDVEQLIQSGVAPASFDGVRAVLYNGYERMTDVIAHAVAPRFPLPAWPRELAE